MALKKFRVGIITLVVLIVLQLLIPAILKLAEKKSHYAPFLENNFRFADTVDNVVLDTFIHHIRNADGYKIVFIGDSVVQGATVKENSATIPAYFQKMARNEFPQRKIRVYNMAVQGNRPSDIYFTLKKLYESKAADFIIMNINYAFYSGEMLKEIPIARSALFKDVMEAEAAKKLNVSYSAVENYIGKNIMDKWNLYSTREEFSFYLFGMNPREKLIQTVKNKGRQPSAEAVLASPVKTQNLDKPWTKVESYPADKLNHWIQVFNVPEMNEKNIGYWFLKKTTEYIKENSIKAAAFFTPMNAGLIDKYDLMRYGSFFNSNCDKMTNEFKKESIPVYNYSNAIKPNEFYDLFHMYPTGNEKTARMLMDNLKETLRNEVER